MAVGGAVGVTFPEGTATGRLVRQVIGESDRFPEIANTFYLYGRDSSAP